MHIEARFYEAYELCAVVSNMLTRRFDYLRELEGFHCDGQWVEWAQPYRKYSVLHQFIEFVVERVHAEQAEAVDIDERKHILASCEDIPAAIEDLKPHKLPVELAFDHYGIKHQAFGEFLGETDREFKDADADDIYDFMNEVRLSEAYEKLVYQTVVETFHVLFQNRWLMLVFNDYVASILSTALSDGVQDTDQPLFSRAGKLRRVKPPKWARRAVFYRDRGRCVLCNTDLTGLINLDGVENYDHIVPIAQFGLNDVSNLQLLCVRCNQQEKRDGSAITSGRYQTWYDYS